MMCGSCELQKGRGAKHPGNHDHYAMDTTILRARDTVGKIRRHSWQIHHCQSKENNVGFGATGSRKPKITMLLESSIRRLFCCHPK